MKHIKSKVVGVLWTLKAGGADAFSDGTAYVGSEAM